MAHVICALTSSSTCRNDVAVVATQRMADRRDWHELCHLHSGRIARGVQSIGMVADVQDNASVAEYVG